jgi:ABC-type uncharacterized transport system substrate-binding protein
MNPRLHWLCSAICLFFLGHVIAPAQAAERVPIIGIPTIAAGPSESIIQEFRVGLRSFGYIEGQNVHVKVKTAQGRFDQLPALAEEMVKLNVDVIVTGASVARAVTQVTSAIPVVIVVHEADPTALRMIEDFGHPGGNLTGVYARESELVGKRLELLKEALSGVTRVAVLWGPFSKFQLENLETAGRSLGLHLDSIEIDSKYDFARAFKRAKRMRAEAAMVLLSPNFYVRRERIADAAMRARLPTMFQNDVMVRAGGLISYGTSFSDTWGRAAYFVDRILKGTKPSDLPVEQVSKFTLAINLKTARALGVKIPDSILLRADEVIR